MSFSYTTQQLLSLRKLFPAPEGLIRIVLSGNGNGNGSTSRVRSARRSSTNTGRRQSKPQQTSSKRQPSEWSRVPVLHQSENSFSVARRKRDQSESNVIVGDIRGILNKISADNYDAIVDEINGTRLFDYAASLDETDEEEFLTDIAKLFVRKSQIDHDFNYLYARIAAEVTKRIDIFGDILYEVCRESIPTVKYDPDRKKDYTGALFLLVELRKVSLISSGGIIASINRLIAAIDRCDPNIVYAVQTEGDVQQQPPNNPVEQTELCIELICKVIPLYLTFEYPEPLNKHIAKLRELQQQKDRIKPRARFMLSDFFKEVERLTIKSEKI